MEAEERNHILFISAQTMVIVSWLEGGREWQEEKRASVKGHKWDISLLCLLPCTGQVRILPHKPPVQKKRNKEKESKKERKLRKDGPVTIALFVCIWRGHPHYFPEGQSPLPSSLSLSLCAIIRLTCSAQFDTSKSAYILIEEISRILAGGESRSHEDVALSSLLIWQSHC